MFVLNGCASYFCLIENQSLKQKILVVTYPPNADIYRDGEKIGTTPQAIKVSRKSTSPLILKKEGYETKEVELNRELNYYACFNCMNVYGFLIDWLTGCLYKFPETSCVQNIVSINEKNVIHRVKKIGRIAESDSIFHYDKTSNLKQSDFQQVLEKKSKLFAAWTSSLIYCTYELNDSMAKVRVLTCFFKKRSYFNQKENNKTKILKHEQQHYNISEITARKIRRKLKSETFVKDSFESKLNSIVFNFIQKNSAKQAKYDNEIYNAITESIFQESKQNVWNEKIKNELDESEDDAKTDIVIRFK